MSAEGIDIVELHDGTDIDAVAAMAAAAYEAAYAHLWDDRGSFGRHLATFGADAFRTLLSTRDAKVWIAEAGGAPVGFATLLLRSDEPVTSQPGGAELARIYVAPTLVGWGLGRRLAEFAERTAAEQGTDYIWLDAMAAAPAVVARYLGWGYRVLGPGRFGGGVRAGAEAMVVLARRLR